MHPSVAFSLFAMLAASTSASPLADVELETRQTASGCGYFAAPRCCVPTVCQCSNGWIYQVNRDAVNAGRHGCDPPWGFIARSNSQFPGYCCREAGGQETEGIAGDAALEYLDQE